MNHLTVYGHLNSGSLNHHLKETVVTTLQEENHKVVIRDLYHLQFDPVLTNEDIVGQLQGIVAPSIQQEQEYIRQADIITFIYPIWWTGLPAIVKGYIDRVMSYGFAYRYEDGVQKGLLKEKKAVIINTHGKSRREYHEMGMDKALSLTSETGIYEYCGLEVIKHFFFDRADRATPEMVEQWRRKLIQIYDCTRNTFWDARP